MAWSTPATVVTGTPITASWGNTYVRDNTRYLKGMDGTIAFEAGATFDTNVLVIDASNNRVGVNRSTPAQSLHVSGPALLASDSNADTGGIIIAQSGSEIVVDTDGRGKVINFHANTLVVGAGADDNVGIGTNSPSSKLHVVGTAAATTFSGSGASLTNLNASNLASGTVPDARFPATLPALNGSALTNLNATNLSSGTLPDARFPAWLRKSDLSIANGASTQLSADIAAPDGIICIGIDGANQALFYTDGSSDPQRIGGSSLFVSGSGGAGQIGLGYSAGVLKAFNNSGGAVNLKVVIIGFAA